MDSDALFIMLTDDGNTLLSVRPGKDGALELLSTPVTILPNSVDDWELPSSTTDNTLNQIDLNVPEVYTQPYLASTEVVNLETQNLCVPNENQNQSVQLTDNLLLNENENPNYTNITSPQNVAESTIERRPLPKKPVISKELSVCLEKISIPSKKIANKKLEPKKGCKTKRQQPCFKCDLCGEEFKKEYLLQKHLHDHAQDKPHHCPKCSATFNVPKNFTLHMATHKIGTPKCPECGRKFARMASLKAHLVKHEMDESLYCTECDDSFPTKSQLEAHASLHSEKWSNEDCRRCRLCGKQFTKPVLYRQHLRDHYKLQMKSSKQTKRGVKNCTIYKCRMCAKVFAKSSLLARHIRIHTGEKPYKCNICKRGFTQKSSVRIHMAQHKDNNPYSCTLCQAKFKIKGNLIAHTNRVHRATKKDQQFYRCTYCPSVFKTLGSRTFHISQVHKDNINDSVAGKEDEEASEGDAVSDKYSQSVDLDPRTDSNDVAESAGEAVKSHSVEDADKEADAEKENDNLEGLLEVDETGGATYITLLDKDGDDFKGKYFKVRQIYVNNCKFYECTFCKKPFKKPCDLIRHLKVHTKEKSFECEVCGQKFALKAALQRHGKRHKSVQSEPENISCDMCKEDFTSQKDFQKHKNKWHTCKKCNQNFTSLEDQNSHFELHHKKSEDAAVKKKVPEELQSLAKEVVLKEPLVIMETDNGMHAKPRYRNEIAHGKGRPHKCPSCPAAFMKVSHLKQHYRTHTGERPFVCDICSSSFGTKSSLNAHYRVHERSRPYTCDICDNNFTTLSGVKRHYITHTNKRAFMCPYCNKTFKSTFSCKLHMKRHKQEIAQEQLELQKKQQGGMKNQPFIINDQKISPLFTQNVSLESNNRSPMVITNTDGTCFTASSSSEYIEPTGQNILLVNDPNVGSVQTLHVGETGAMTLSNFNDSQMLSPENIREIEEKLNQQLLGLGVNLTLGNVVKGIDQQSNATTETQEQPMLSIIYENGTTLHSPVTVSASVNPNVYNPNFGNIDISQIALQNNNAMNIGIVQADCTNMINVVSNSIQENLSCSQQMMKGNVEINYVHQNNEPVENNLVENEIPPQNVESINVMQNIENFAETSNLKCHMLSEQQLSTDNLKKCLKTRGKNKKFECKDCSAEFQSAGGLRKHIKKTHKLQETHKCYECNQEFKTSLQLRQHIKEHVKKELKLKNSEEAKEMIFELESEAKEENAKKKKKINMCQYCPRTFSKPSDLIRHVRTHTGERPYACRFCSRRFTVKCTLDTHLKTHSSEKFFYCHVCNSRFATKNSMKLHLRSHKNDRESSLQKSEKTSTGIDILAAEVEKLAEDNEAVNTLNSKLDYSQNLLQNGTETESLVQTNAIEPQQTFETNQATNTFNSEINSSQTLLQITDESQDLAQMTVIEQQQNFEEKGEANFDQSLTDLTIPNEISFSTDVTNSEILTLDDDNQLVANLQYLLANGLVTIQTEDPESNQVSLTTTLIPSNFEKDKAPEETAVSQVFFKMESPDSTLPTTLPTENNLAMNNYMILQLDSVDSTVQIKNDDADLKAEKSQSKKLKHSCEICKKSFKKPCLLKRHKRTHTGERPFQCDVCNKSFSQKTTLQLHYRNHTGMKPYSCTECNKTFTQSGNLHTHMKRVHKIDPIEAKRTAQLICYDAKFPQTNVILNDLSFVDFLK